LIKVPCHGEKAKSKSALKPWLFLSGKDHMYSYRAWNDRRRFQRLNVNLTVWYRIDTPLYLRNLLPEGDIEASMLDLSSGGMAFLAEYHIPAYTILVIKFVLFKTKNDGLVSVSEPIRIRGEVRSSIAMESGKYRLGVCFKDVSMENKSEITGFVHDTSKI